MIDPVFRIESLLLASAEYADAAAAEDGIPLYEVRADGTTFWCFGEVEADYVRGLCGPGTEVRQVEPEPGTRDELVERVAASLASEKRPAFEAALAGGMSPAFTYREAMGV